MRWFVKCLQNYVTFSGRARRKEFWMFYLFYTIFGLVICFIQGLAGMEDPMLLGIYVLAMCLPAISVLVRRLPLRRGAHHQPARRPLLRRHRPRLPQGHHPPRRRADVNDVKSQT